MLCDHQPAGGGELRASWNKSSAVHQEYKRTQMHYLKVGKATELIENAQMVLMLKLNPNFSIFLVYLHNVFFSLINPCLYN